MVAKKVIREMNRLMKARKPAHYKDWRARRLVHIPSLVSRAYIYYFTRYTLCFHALQCIILIYHVFNFL